MKIGPGGIVISYTLKREREGRTMAKATTTKTTPAASVAKGEGRYWVMQQGREYYVVESDSMPSLEVKSGERSIKFHSHFDTLADANTKAAFLADHFQGEVRK